jgi:dTMP kinase
MPEGRFITFEGGEGTGKSTQIARLSSTLAERGRDVVVTREPGGTEGAEAIRALLVNGEAGRWDPVAEALLNYAARQDHLARVIRPALKRGAWVLCDRFHDSTRAYQGVAGGVDAALIVSLEQAVIADTEPDLTIILDLDVAKGLERAGRRADASTTSENRFEAKGTAFHETLRQAFLDIAASEPERCAVIDADATPDAVADAVWQCVVSRLKP